jgi:uncharacterized protein (DUF736 family)
MENTKTNKRPKVGAVWVRKSQKDGSDYLSIQLELDGKKIDFRGWKNDYKTEDKHPDYNLFFKEDKGGVTTNTAKPVSKAASKPTQAKVAEPPTEDLL